MRNFWIDATIDDRKTPIATGPRAKDGGFDLTISQRSAGAELVTLVVIGRADGDKLTLQVYSNVGNCSHLVLATRTHR